MWKLAANEMLKLVGTSFNGIKAQKTTTNGKYGMQSLQ